MVSVEAIPVPYAAQLDSLRNAQILAEVQVFGTTIGDVDVDFKPFVFPIQLCFGCLVKCLADVTAGSKDVSAAYGDSCPDDSGADGRICVRDCANPGNL